ncbi:MAG TPA: hypothetical protein VFE98_02630 [Candidatus Bathyarchaeia archaeon]|nr:hypothetical protein [Candidatus Bathyarchaeia archaeon]
MTTIQVDDRILRMLAALKQQYGVGSYQEVLEILMSDKRKIPRSLYGHAKGSRTYRHDAEDEHTPL